MRRITFGLAAAGLGAAALTLAPGSAGATETVSPPQHCQVRTAGDTFQAWCKGDARYRAVIECRSNRDPRFVYTVYGGYRNNEGISTATCRDVRKDDRKKQWIDFAPVNNQPQPQQPQLPFQIPPGLFGSV